jgi:hypothetical protein
VKWLAAKRRAAAMVDLENFIVDGDDDEMIELDWY